VVRNGAARGILELSFADEKYLSHLEEELRELLNSAMGLGGFPLYHRTPRNALLTIEKALLIICTMKENAEINDQGRRVATVPIAISLSEVLSLLEPFIEWDNEKCDNAIEMDRLIIERIEIIVEDLQGYLEGLLEEKKPARPPTEDQLPRTHQEPEKKKHFGLF
jgi:hypothetical protein